MCQVTQNVFLKCMTVPVATELSVSCLRVSIFICISSTDVKVQLCFSMVSKNHSTQFQQL